SFARVARGEAFGGVELRTVPRDPTFLQTPRLTASSVAGSVKLDWEPVPGATAYEVFEAPDRRTPFGDVPSQTVTELAALLPEPAEGERPYYAISAIVGGRSTMVHPLVAAPSPAPLGTGDADPLGAPKGTCGLTTVTIGAAKLIASCFRKNGDVYTSSGRVRVNGIDLTPQNAVVSVDVAKAKISVSNVRLQLGTVVLYQGRFEWSPKVEKHFALAPNVRIGGLAVTGEMSVLVRTDRAELTGRIKLPEALGGVHGRLRLVGTNENGPKVDLFEISAGGARVGRLGLDELGLSYKRGSGGDLWTGTTQVSVPRGPSSMTLRGELKILNGGFKGASIEADHINQHIAYGVFLQRLRGGVEINPLTLEGGIGISAGPSVAGRTLLRVDGDVSIRFSDPQVYSVRGEVKIFDATVRSGYVRYTTSGLFEFGGEMGFEKGPFKARAGIDGWVDNMRAAEARGWGEFSVPGASFSAEGVVSSVGLAACRRGFGPDVGAGYRWGDRDVTIFASSCDIGPYRATRARDGAERFVVAEGQAVEVLAIRGDGGAPQVVLEGPNGERIAAPDGGAGIDRPELMLVQYPDHRTTYVALQRPAAGEWRISAVPGS
ncbi:MAG TPA: hypothetical protein VLK58_13000, partial [Conexibacter sp.]|nr:hypothetical protein [Conexibacter sp.]